MRKSIAKKWSNIGLLILAGVACCIVFGEEGFFSNKKDVNEPLNGQKVVSEAKPTATAQNPALKPAEPQNLPTPSVPKNTDSAVKSTAKSVVNKVASLTNKGLDQKSVGTYINMAIDVPIKGETRVAVLDNRTLCVIGDYSNFLKERFKAECGDLLKTAVESSLLPAWSKNFYYHFLGVQIVLKYRPAIAEFYQDWQKFELVNGPKISEGGYWVNTSGLLRFFHPTPYRNRGYDSCVAQVLHFAYLRLEEPLKEGAEYAIINPNGERTTFRYVEKENFSDAIKVNQLGYSAAAGRKFGYVGAWLGNLGAMDLSHLQGKEFVVYREGTTEEVSRGALRRCAVADPLYQDKGPSFVGEDTFEMDLSALNTPGNYYVFVPEVGRSHVFSIGEDTIGEAFYIHAKGLYHKRCGIAKKEPYTKWTSGECHKTTYRLNFPPMNQHYTAGKDDRDYGFFDADGRSVTVTQFDLIEQNQPKTNEEREKIIAEGVFGGWHDAADYDRRPYHYDVVDDLLCAYMWNSENFVDNQLNIPESGNGIPDILDEAIWGMEVWYRAQQSDGGVGGWIEATSHPKNWNPGTDEQPYYLSAATLGSSMQYAAYAAFLARALLKAGEEELSHKYLESAKRAYVFALDPSNRFQCSYQCSVMREVDGKKVKEIEKVFYKEPQSPPVAYLFKASLELYLLTGNRDYLYPISDKETEIKNEINALSYKTNPIIFSELIDLRSEKLLLISRLVDSYYSMVIRNADLWLSYQENNYPYRMTWYPADHAYVSHTSWGNFHPGRRAFFFILAYQCTKDKKYRDAVYLCNDWQCGVNPNGQTLTAGLGYNYPVQFLDLPSVTDEIAEYILGISPYRNTFSMPRAYTSSVFGLFYDERTDHGFAPKPRVLVKNWLDKPEGEITQEELRVAVANKYPFWRRFPNLEAFTVDVSEYTVSETIAPAVLMSGFLLNEPWKPTEKVMNREPVRDIRELKGYWSLP